MAELEQAAPQTPTALPTAVEPMALPVEIIPISSIAYLVDNHRPAMDERKLQELVSNIRTNGVKQPIKVCRREHVKHGTVNVMVFGHRRVKASELAGLATIPAMIAYGMSDQQIAEEQCIENIHREDVGPIGEGHAVKTLMNGKRTIELVASMLNKPITWAKGRLNLLRLDKQVQDLVNIGRLPLGHAQEISKVGDLKRQLDLAQSVIGLHAFGETNTMAAAIAGDYVTPLRNLRKDITYLMCKMGSTYWPKDSEYGGRRPCLGCPDNTNTEPALFEGITLTSAKGNCTNPECYRHKAQAWEKDPVKKARDKEREEKKAAAGKPASVGKTAAKEEPKRKFPDSPSEKFAVAMHQYGEKLVKAIRGWGESKHGPLHMSDALLPHVLAELAHLWATRSCLDNWGLGNIEIRIGRKNSLSCSQLTKLLVGEKPFYVPAGLVANLAAALKEPGYTPHWASYSKKLEHVPFPPQVVEFIGCLEAFCKRRDIAIKDVRPKLADFPDKPAAAPVKDPMEYSKIVRCSKGEALRTIKQCTDLETLLASQKDSLAKGDWRRAAVAKRIAQLS